MQYDPTVNLVSGRLVACYEDSCEIFKEGSWQHLQDTRATRTGHSSATREEAVLLIGGSRSNSTEWIPVDGSASQPGPVTVRHGYEHCTKQLSDDIIVVTGGIGTESFVTEYNLIEGMETPLTPMGQPRYNHACGVYQDADDQQVSKILGKNNSTDTNTNALRQKVYQDADDLRVSLKGFKALSTVQCVTDNEQFG